MLPEYIYNDMRNELFKKLSCKTTRKKSECGKILVLFYLINLLSTEGKKK